MSDDNYGYQCVTCPCRTSETCPIEELQLAYNNAVGQIQEAIAVLESGTDYEKLHLKAILSAGITKEKS